MMEISRHMWIDESSKPRFWYGDPPYCENNNVDLAVWDETVALLGKYKYNLLLIDVGDGIKYESHPEISAPDAWDKDFLKKKLDEIRALGITPIPKLNFSTGHDTWLKKYRRMISTPEYYQVGADLIKEVSEAFGTPELFHLGFDEETPAHQTNYEMIIVRGEKLWWHDLNYLANQCEKAGTRPWIWSDYIWHHEESFLKNMSHEIMQSNWYYGRFTDAVAYPEEKNYIAAYETLDKNGYEQIPTCSSWENVDNLWQTMAHTQEKLNPELVRGIMVAPWLGTSESGAPGLRCEAERFYNSRAWIYPETV